MKKYFSSYWIRSAFYTFLQRFSLTFFGFINLLILVRTLSTEQMGTWALFLTITGIFEQTKSNLLKNAHIKYVSSSPDRDEKTAIASSSFVINSGISVFFIVIIVIFSGQLGKWLNARQDLAEMLRWFIPGLFFMIFFSHLEAIQQSFLDFKGVFKGYFLRQLFFLCVIVFHKLLKIQLTLPGLAMYQSISIAIGTILLYFSSKQYLHFKFIVSRVWIKKIFHYGGYIFGSGLLANICANLDQLMTAKFINVRSVAYYNVSSRIGILIDTPSYAASEIIFPKAARASAEEGKEKVKYLFERMVGILFAFTIPTALFIMIFPGFVIRVIAGEKYMAATFILQLYICAAIFRPFQNQAANLLNSIGRVKLGFIINAVGLVEFLVINYLCLLKFGFYGAAIGSLITTLIGIVTWYFIMRRVIDLNVISIFNHAVNTYRLLYKEFVKITSRSKEKKGPIIPM